MQSTLVVVGFAEALAAPEVLWSLVDSGFEVIAFRRRGRYSALLSSRHVVVHEITAPEISTARAKDELLALLSSINGEAKACVLLPIDDASLWLCGQIPRVPGWIFAGPAPHKVKLAIDKRKQIEAARLAGFRVPETWIVSSRSDLEAVHSSLLVILRPAEAVFERDGRLMRGSNWICSNQSELRMAEDRWQERNPLLVQPYLSGVGEGVFGLATSTGVVAWSAHRRLRMMNPHGSGSSACISQPVPKEIQESAERFVRASDWRGLFMIELLCDRNGGRSFVEFNGRAWGSMALARRQGLEYPAWTVGLALEPKFSPQIPAMPFNKIECRNLGRELMHFLFVLRGPKSRAAKPWPSFWATIRDFFRGLSRASFYNWRHDDRRVFWTDTLNTIREQVFKRKA